MRFVSSSVITTILVSSALLALSVIAEGQTSTNNKQKVVQAVAKKAAVSTNVLDSKVAAARKPSGISDSQQALEVKGQSRNLSMMLVLKNRGDNIDFVKPRQNYQNEIKNTGF